MVPILNHSLFININNKIAKLIIEIVIAIGRPFSPVPYGHIKGEPYANHSQLNSYNFFTKYLPLNGLLLTVHLLIYRGSAPVLQPRARLASSME